MKNTPASLSGKNIYDAISRQRWLIVIPIILSVVIYWQTLRFDFVTYDDYELVYENSSYLSQLSNIVTSFKTHVFTTHRTESAYYRPLLLVSYIADYQMWGLNPTGYHRTNLLFHALTVMFLFLLVERLTREKIVALVCSALFAVHPIQTEAVSWVAGRNDVLLGFFIVLMMYAYVRYRENPATHQRYFWMTAIAFACALSTKESAAFYLLLLPLYDLCYRPFIPGGIFDRRFLRDFSLIVFILLLYLGVRSIIFGEIIGAERLYGGGTNLWDRVQQIPGLLTAHCLLLVLPLRLSVVHPLEQLPWIHSPWSWLGIAATVALGILLWWSWKNDKILFFGVAWLAVGLIPTLNLFPVAVQILEHRLYVPMMGFAFAVNRGAYLLAGVQSGAIRKERVFIMLAGIVIVLCLVLSYARVPVWKNSETLWNDAIEKAPTYSRSYFNLAGWYFERREYTKTTELLEKFITLVPDDYLAHSKLRQSYYLAGRYSDAVRICRKMIALSPTNFNRYTEAAELYMQLQQPDSAIAIYTSGIERNPGSHQLCDLLGRVYVRVNREGEAERWFRRAIEINPQFPQARFDLGVLYASKERNADALAQIEEGAQYGSPEKDVAQLLYHLYVDAGRMAQAESVRRRYNF